ncbi:MAG: tryptophan synthase subunit alpha [Saprospiraceae bacterium]
MTNRIHELFQRKKEKVLSVYFTAGFPQLQDTLPILQGLEEAGVDIVELGFPFSDPLADGPVIQESSQKAIANGMNLKFLFEQLTELRRFVNIPVIMMGYLNPVLQYGEDAFIEKCAEIGIDGVIIPDMPLDYYQSMWKEKCRVHNLANILLITPQTSENRIREIDENTTGFIYMVSSNGITGSNKNLNMQSDYFKRIGSMKLRNPILAGFGIHDQHSFENASNFSNGAIIGSAFIRHLVTSGISKTSINQFVQNIRP